MPALELQMRSSRESFQTVVKRLIRSGLVRRETPEACVEAADLGSTPGLNCDNIGELLERIDGPMHR